GNCDGDDAARAENAVTHGAAPRACESLQPGLPENAGGFYGDVRRGRLHGAECGGESDRNGLRRSAATSGDAGVFGQLQDAGRRFSDGAAGAAAFEKAEGSGERAGALSARVKRVRFGQEKFF